MERTGFSDMAADASAEDSLHRSQPAVDHETKEASRVKLRTGSNFEHPRLSVQLFHSHAAMWSLSHLSWTFPWVVPTFNQRG
jgi:hypothetical protein